MTTLCEVEPSRIVDFAEIKQVVLPLNLDTICEIGAGRNVLHLAMIACNFTNIGRGYDLKVSLLGLDPTFLRGSKTGIQRFLLPGHSEFWDIHLRARESWIIEGAASDPASIAVTISSTDLVTELVDPDGSAKCA
jgi:hypothetical protein